MSRRGSKDLHPRKQSPKSLANLNSPRKHRFSKENQPSPEKKSAGLLMRYRGQKLAQAVLGLAFKGAKDSDLRRLASEYFGVPESAITVETMTLFRMIERTIQKGDPAAFRAVWERAYGLPKQPVDVTTDGEALLPAVTFIVQDQATQAALENIRPAPGPALPPPSTSTP